TFSHISSHACHTLSLHDALPIYRDHGGARPTTGRQAQVSQGEVLSPRFTMAETAAKRVPLRERIAAYRDSDAPVRKLAANVSKVDRKSTRLNSSHLGNSYAVFCL